MNTTPHVLFTSECKVDIQIVELICEMRKKVMAVVTINFLVI